MEKRILAHYWWGCKLVQPLWKTAWGFLSRLHIELLYDHQSLCWVCIQGNKVNVSEASTLPCLLYHCPQPARKGSNLTLIKGWVDEENVVCTDNETLLGHSKSQILSFEITWVEVEVLMWSKMCRTQKYMCIISQKTARSLLLFSRS